MTVTGGTVTGAVGVLFTNDAKGILLAITELIGVTGQEFPSAGPFQVDVTDPSGAVQVVAGSDDQTTPTKFLPAGAGKVGTVTVKVTDQSNGLSGQSAFAVQDPPAPPPTTPDTLRVQFVPAP
jgi:hypothetical protein